MQVKNLLLSRLWRSLVLVAGLLLVAVPSWAGKTLNIYKATALVKNQSEGERNRAARATLGEVLVRVSGRPDAASHPLAQEAIANAQQYLFGFSYGAGGHFITEGEQRLPAMELQLDYAPQAIEQLLREAQLPLWPAQRPQVLVWLVVKTEAGYGFDTSPESLAALQSRAAYRGLPLVMPKLDMDDQLLLSAEDVWNFDLPAIAQASRRYKADAVLVARITPSSLGPIPPANYTLPSADEPLPIADELSLPAPAPEPVVEPMPDALPLAEPAPPLGPWLGDWQLLQGDLPETVEHQAYSGETPELAPLLGQMMDNLADKFGSEYAIVSSGRGPQRLSLRLDGIADFGAFKQAQSYLAKLAMIKKMSLEQVDAQGALFALEVEGDVKLLVTTLALAKRMQPRDPQALAEQLNRLAPAPVAEAAPALPTEADEAALAAQLDGQLAGLPAMPAAAAEPAPGSQANPLQYLWLK